MPEFVTSRREYEQLLLRTDRHERPCGNAACELGRNPLDLTRTIASLSRRVDDIAETLESLRQKLKPIKYASLNSIDAFYLYCVLTVSSFDWGTRELPAAVNHSQKLAPTLLLTEEVYSRLRSLGIIVPSVYSALDSFNIGGSRHGPVTYNSIRVSWTMAADHRVNDSDHLLNILLSRFNSPSESTRKKLRANLVEHECLGLISTYLTYLNLGVDALAEARLRQALGPIIQNLPVRSIAGVIKEVFADGRFRAQLYDYGAGRVVDNVLARLNAYTEEMPRFNVASDTASSVNDHMLRDSSTLMSRVFFRYFSGDGINP